MIVALIIACEVGFWVLLAAGLAVRYLLKWRRTSVVLLLCEPVLELVLFVVTAIDLRNGAEPSWEHGLAALYIGFTVAYGHYTIRWLDGHAAHRLAGAPRPPKPPRYGLARARHEGRPVAPYGPDGGGRVRAAAGRDLVRRRRRHLVAAVLPVDLAQDRRHPRHHRADVCHLAEEAAGVSAPRPGPRARPRPPCSPSGQG